MKTCKDPRIIKFAEKIVNQSVNVEKGDNVYLVSNSVETRPLFEEVRRQIIKKGAVPYEHFVFDSQLGTRHNCYDWINNASEDQLNQISEVKRKELEAMDAYINISGNNNSRDLTNLSSEKITTWKQTTRELLETRLKTEWVTTRFPTDGMAQKAGMSTPDYEEMVFDSVVEADYEKMRERNQKIKKVMDKASEVQIKSKNTDLKFSLKGRNGVSAYGQNNLPDGEVFYAPIKDSVEGHIEFTYPGVYGGNEVSGIKLWFENGEIVDFEASENQQFLERMINTDEGSKYIGEFGIGTNKEIDQYTKETIFDEKIGGTVHFAIGSAYDRCVPEDEEKNTSTIHWDIVKDLRAKKDGGKIIVDGEVVQEDGRWLIDE